ncbi:unnamed protein product [Didymodactylos carnosus]|uniref:Carrier domain-containing protein n=1 Tax=Didymodactylos carnosus TaxID=1234261 RepID=A0A815H660_9BILA|nr:unnamed protein product [Didymodactylos carnosus]CAF4214732.1 unnamed protein product [Didymodactylos carnosus]
MAGNFFAPDKQWNWVKIPDARKPYIRFLSSTEDDSSGKELIHLPNDPFLAVDISNRPDGSYSTGDLFIEVTPNSGHYIIRGRNNDTIVHINGEKTNPVPMEKIIRNHSIIKEVVILGHQRFCTCALIELNFDEASQYDFEQIEEKVLYACKQANLTAPSHSRLIKEMIKILPLSKHLPVTHKGNVKRNQVVDDYSTLIDAMYNKFFNVQNVQEQQQKQNWTNEKIKNYLKEKIPIKSIDYDKSLFDSYSFDSLSVMQLRHNICNDIVQIEQNFIYEHSSINSMAKQLMRLLDKQQQQSNDGDDDSDDPYRYKLTEHIIDKFSQLIKQETLGALNSASTTITNKNRVFLITGANGSLGSWIIRDLLLRSNVDKIYCLIRGPDQARFYQTFQQRNDEQILHDNEKRFIVLDSMDLSQQYLGQTEEMYKELQENVTDIIHSAWKVNFNLTIKDFENDCINGTYHLLKLAKAKKMRFHFISSVSSAGSGQIIKEEPLPRQPGLPLKQGYGQSKYASEHICWIAMKEWGMLN